MMCVHVHTRIYMCVCTYAHVCMQLYMCACVCVRVYVCVCVHACVCVCMVCRDVWAAGTWQHREAVITTDGGTAHRQDCLPPGLWQLPHCKQTCGHARNKRIRMLLREQLRWVHTELG